MGDANAGHGVGLGVLNLGFQRAVSEEASDNISGIVDDDLRQVVTYIRRQARWGHA